jgi:hypothetical protein
VSRASQGFVGRRKEVNRMKKYTAPKATKISFGTVLAAAA